MRVVVVTVDKSHGVRGRFQIKFGMTFDDNNKAGWLLQRPREE